MPMMNCPECGQQMSDTAYACPNCGWHHKSIKTWNSIKKFSILTIVLMAWKIVMVMLAHHSYVDPSTGYVTHITEGYFQIGSLSIDFSIFSAIPYAIVLLSCVLLFVLKDKKKSLAFLPAIGLVSCLLVGALYILITATGATAGFYLITHNLTMIWAILFEVILLVKTMTYSKQI